MRYGGLILANNYTPIHCAEKRESKKIERNDCHV